MDNPQDTGQGTAGDRARRFLFEEADIRGETVQLETAWRDILSIHQYAPGVSRLLGELLAAGMNTSAAGGDQASTYLEHAVLNWLKEIDTGIGKRIDVTYAEQFKQINVW